MGKFSFEDDVWYKLQTRRWEQLESLGYKFTSAPKKKGYIGMSIGNKTVHSLFVTYVPENIRVREIHTRLLVDCEEYVASQEAEKAMEEKK